MNLSRVPTLRSFRESGTWYRAILARFASTPLATAHSTRYVTRFNPGPKTTVPFQTLYLAESAFVAAFEVGALLGKPYAAGGVFAGSRTPWLYLPITVNLSHVADLTEWGASSGIPDQAAHLDTSIQELTGDWVGYDLRGAGSSVSGPTGIAPTQGLGEALATSGWEAVRVVSQRIPDCRNLVIFPGNLRSGSWLAWEDLTSGGQQRINGSLP